MHLAKFSRAVRVAMQGVEILRGDLMRPSKVLF